MNIGKIVAIAGPVVDVEFEEGKLPHIREMEAGIVSNSIAEKCRVIFQGQETGEIELLEKGVPGHAAAPENCVNPVGLLGDRVRKLAEDGRLVLT